MIRNDIPQAPILKEGIKQYLPENPRILEAGAHIGRDTVKLSKLWPQEQFMHLSRFLRFMNNF